MALLDRKKLLEKDDFQIKKVDLGGGDFVYVREMSGYDRNQLELSMTQEVRDEKGNVSFRQNLENFRGKLLVNTLCDEKGNLLLKPEDSVAFTKAKSASFVERLADEAQALNKITDRDRDALLKN